jgi:hypothetical protein
MPRLDPHRPLAAVIACILILVPGSALAGFSVDEDPRETQADPGDVFFPGLVCDMDDGDGSCPIGTQSLNLPNPSPFDDPTFDMDGWAIDLPLEVCPSDPPFPPGILFSIDDGDAGPGVGKPDNSTEMFFYDHCMLFGPRASYNTSITESALGLLGDPPPRAEDDDVDAYDTRSGHDAYLAQLNLLFSPDWPSNGGLGPGSEAHIWFVSIFSPAPTVWADAATQIGVPDPENCDVDGIARIFDPDTQAFLFTTDLNAPCGLDPGDIYISDRAGNILLYADDVNDLKIAANEHQEVDIDALAINDGGDFVIGDPFEPDDPTLYKADWPNYAPSGMPDFSQDHTGWPPTWCGPTAVADSLWWFDSEMACDRDRTTGQLVETESNDTCDIADTLGEVPPIPGSFAAAIDVDWYEFAIPGKPHRICRVTVSTCALAQPGDNDTMLSLYGDCNAGVPGDLIATNDDACPGNQSEIVADLEAGRSYWVRVDQSPVGLGGPNYTLSLGIDCYPMVERYPSTPDDHSEYNPVELIPNLSWCMNTDDQWGLGSGHTGTRIPEMDACIDQWLNMKGLNDMYTKVVALSPLFTDVADEVEKSEDVVLLLGFWWNAGGGWVRCGGHYVTAAGVDSLAQTVTISDPALNNAEAGAAGRVRGPTHIDHAPAAAPPPDHDDTQNISHDRYASGASNVPWISQWSLPGYATNGGLTTCADVARWCMLGLDWGQNPSEPPEEMEGCPDPQAPVSTEVEVMVDVSPIQTPICVFLDSGDVWPDNLRVRKGACAPAMEVTQKDVIRGKLCNLRFRQIVPQVELGFAQCLYDDSSLTEFDELSPDDTRCMEGWFYLIRQTGDPDYGNASPGGEARNPDSGGCP